MNATRRTTIHLDASLHRALSAKSADTDQSVSELVNAAVRQSLLEDADDLSIIASRRKEPRIRFETVLRGLKRRGTL